MTASCLAGPPNREPPSRRWEKILVQRAGQLMYELSTHYPVVSGIQPEYAWATPIHDDDRRVAVCWTPPQLSSAPLCARSWAQQSDCRLSFLARAAKVLPGCAVQGR